MKDETEIQQNEERREELKVKVVAKGGESWKKNLQQSMTAILSDTIGF
jgi:phenylacetate-coenzyme A ligase PaaK-like adenylate-forming protein